MDLITKKKKLGLSEQEVHLGPGTSCTMNRTVTGGSPGSHRKPSLGSHHTCLLLSKEARPECGFVIPGSTLPPWTWKLNCGVQYTYSSDKWDEKASPEPLQYSNRGDQGRPGSALTLLEPHLAAGATLLDSSFGIRTEDQRPFRKAVSGSFSGWQPDKTK